MSRATGVGARVAFVAAVAAVTWLRLTQVVSLPVITGDVVRNLAYGAAVLEWGLRAASRPLAELSPAWNGLSWANLPYGYPPLALAFFAAISALSPTVFAAKLALTAIEGVNGLLIGRLTESRWLGLVYWASPASIWWVSREGQFEPLQSLFTLLALLILSRSTFTAGVSLALAAQAKVTALALAPWLAHRAAEGGVRRVALGALGLALGLVPWLAGELEFRAVTNVLRFSSPLTYNPYYWNPGAGMFSWNPSWLIWCDQLASWGMLVALATYAVRTRNLWSVAAPLAFVLFCKVHTNVQFWYWLLLAPLLAPIEDRRWRFALIALVPLLDVSSTVSLLGWPVGQHGYRGADSVYFRYEVPR